MILQSGTSKRTVETRLFWARSRAAIVCLMFAVAALAMPRAARAEADLFGLGDGHSNAYTAVGADEIINTYAPITATTVANAVSVTIDTPIGDPAGFVAGDLVMVWRATGLTLAEAPSSSARIDLTSNAIEKGRVGTFELARVKTVAAGTITFTKPLVNAWLKDVTQLVKVPEYTTVDVPAGTGIAAVAWQSVGNGFAGGILAFLANGTVTIGGRVHADARGFRGGAKDANTDLHVTCAGLEGTEANGFANKGEGVAPTEFGATLHGGRGNHANGAGGGNCAENGGGGGGSFGQGGNGGNSVVGQAASGLGGAGLDYSLLSRFTMGGGGGAGEQKNGVGSGGGAGGGTVFIRARKIQGAGFISANGEDAVNAGLFGIESDGAGGGGAGGSIVIRAVDTVTCGGAQVKGGKGGDTDAAAASVFGAGGGGGGGRVFIQSNGSAACTANVVAGTRGVAAAGLGANGGAGLPGAQEGVPTPGGRYCFSNPATNAQCANPRPVCVPGTGFCDACAAPFGGMGRTCAVATQPVCSPNGACSPCNGDLGSGVDRAFACQLGKAPFCFLTGPTTGACGKCGSAADCAGDHAGPACNTTLGQCGTPCTDDAQCKAGKEWCAQNVCVPKTINGDRVPAIPPANGVCTVEAGKRVCLSAVCEQDDNLCGLRNDSPCEGKNERCRSGICFAADQICGKPTGEACMLPGDCRTEVCTDNVCVGCSGDVECQQGKICDVTKAMCVPGCRVVNGADNCPKGKECNKQDGTDGMCVDNPNMGGPGPGEGGDPFAAGIIEGGGCACRTSMPLSSGTPYALAVAAAAGVLIARRRRKHGEAQDGDTKGEG